MWKSHVSIQNLPKKASFQAISDNIKDMKSVVSVSGLEVVFDGQPVLENVDFALERGESLAIIGPNGAGKSVLIRALLGMIPLQRGTIAWAPGARIGYVPQKIDADRHLPVNFRNLLAAKASIAHPKLSSTDVDEIIKTVGLTEKILSTPVGHLSGGQFQRALIAFALLGLVGSPSDSEVQKNHRVEHPGILILDEPTASIDKPGEEQIYELIHRLQDEYNITVILVSHDLSFVYRYANKVLCLNHAEVCFGTPEEALTPAMLEKLYGGPMKFYHHHQS